MIVTLAGHVDHGKTSLVRTLTGVDTDRLAEERRRGLTIDLGFAYAVLDGARVGFVDVPGHHRFIHNMVAGVAGRQHALLVVAADDGVMPQSREHLQILTLLGLESGVVALTKIDRVARDRIAAARGEIAALVAGSFLKDAPVIALSCTTGAGVPDLREHLAQATRVREAPAAAAPFRLAIDRAFTVRGSGVVATGTVVAGRARVDERLLLATSGKQVRVRDLHVQGVAADAAAAGDRAAINLAGADVGEVRRGDWLIAPETRDPATRFAMRLQVLADFPRPVRHNAPVHVYHATSHIQARVLLIDSGAVRPGGTALADLRCETPLHVKVGDRVVLRDQDRQRTLGGGQVLDLAPDVRRRSPARRTRLAAVRPAEPQETLAALATQAPVSASAFGQHWNLAATQVATLATASGLRTVGDHVLPPAVLESASDRMRQTLAEYHRRQPASAGLTAAEIDPHATASGTIQQLALQALVDAGAVRLENGRYALAAHRAVVPDEVRQMFAEVRPLLDSNQPPSLGDMAKRLQRPFAALDAALRALPAFGLAVRVSPTRYYLPERLAALADAATRLAATGPFTVRQFRDATGVGRNIVIEVLEHFDGKGFTRRHGDTRTVVGEKESVA